jgi:hypothetical protein
MADMELHPFQGVEWTRSFATEHGTCAASGDEIAPGDEIYETDHPSYAGRKVLVRGYEEYLRAKFRGGRRLDSLTVLANRYGSDKGDKWHGCHGYAEIYDRLFNARRRAPLACLEIGLLHPFDTEGAATRAPSLQMWREYFPNARLFGFDINDFSKVAIPNCTIFKGDMGARADLLKLAQSVGRPFDIILEDASHASHHQQIALATLFPFVSDGGLYLIEDLHWQSAALEQKGIPKTRSLLRDFTSSGTLRSPVITADESKYLEEHIESISFFDSQDKYNQGKDGLAVIAKRGLSVAP